MIAREDISQFISIEPGSVLDFVQKSGYMMPLSFLFDSNL